jgi:hypothetical protein
MRIATSKLKTNPNNPRSIRKDQLQKLVKSLREFPEMLEARPIVVDPDFVVLGGNMRLKAAQEAGLKEVPVYVASWEEAKHKEFIIKDNLAFGEWDWDMLANEWDAEELDDWGLDVPFEDEPTEGLTDPDDVPEVPEEPTTKPGDLWLLGDHRLLCGDSTKAEDVERLMDGKKADMAFTDPPYNVEYTGGIQYKNGKKVTNNREMIANDDRDLYPEGCGHTLRLRGRSELRVVCGHKSLDPLRDRRKIGRHSQPHYLGEERWIWRPRGKLQAKT